MKGSYLLTDKQRELTARLEAAGFQGSWWGRAEAAERFYFADFLRSGGKPVRRCKCWLQFDDPATLEGCALKAEAPKRWYEVALARRHAPAFALAVEMTDPLAAAQLRLEMATAPEELGDMVGGQDA